MKPHVPKSAALLVLMTLLTGCSGMFDGKEAYSSTALFIKVTDKAHSDDYKQKWIIAHNSSASDTEDVKIYVDNSMVWNLIDVGSEYFASYEGSKEKGYHLAQINHPDDPNVLR